MQNIVDDILLKKVGTQLVFFIRRRTLKGELLPGSTSEEYSEKPFAMPFGGLPKGLGAKAKKDKENYQLFTSKSKSLWVVVSKGYKHLKELAGKDSSKVNMTWSGSYLRDLSVIAVTNAKSDGTSVIGWKSQTNEQLAYWHEIAGAGKSKAKHKILGATVQEEIALAAYTETQVFKSLKDWAKQVSEKYSDK